MKSIFLAFIITTSFSPFILASDANSFSRAEVIGAALGIINKGNCEQIRKRNEADRARLEQKTNEENRAKRRRENCCYDCC
jgi:hypothetical protein